MDEHRQAEHDRLQRAIDNGPARRITADKAAGRPATKADTEQAALYRAAQRGLVRAR